MSGHENSSAAFLGWAFTTKSANLSVFINLVEFKDSQLDFLMFVGSLFGGGVILLLAFLGTTTKAEHQVKGRLLLDVVVTQGATILQLLASEDQSLLIRGDT